SRDWSSDVCSSDLANACASASTTSAQNNHSCQPLASACSASSRPPNCGTLNSPNQCSGKPDAALTTQPLTGIANSKAYSSPWVREAARACQVGVPGTGGGAPA